MTGESLNYASESVQGVVVEERVILRSPLTRTVDAVVTVCGDMDKEAFDRLIAILAEMRNGWDDGR